jgi:hypothetical protein
LTDSWPLTATIVGIVAAALLAAFALWRDNRPYVPGKVWRVPWRAIGFVAIVAAMVLAAHLISLLTGTPFQGRMG